MSGAQGRMGRSRLLVLFALAFLAYSAHAAIVEHTFNVGNFSLSQLCKPARVITAVNKQLPGPTLHVREGDSVVVHVVNNSPYNVTVHWHGIFQRGSQWADGPEMVTQCPIRPGLRYAYGPAWNIVIVLDKNTERRYNVTGQEGTLWWHAHSSMLRATVHGAIVIKPRLGGHGYPFPKPDKEEILLLGEWWNDNVVDLDRDAFLTGELVRPADAYTINGKPGDLYKCAGRNHRHRTHRLKVQSNSTYLLRVINAAVNTPLFFKVAGHRFTVVGADASYTTKYRTDVIVVAPGQTVDALMVADADPSRLYYMAASPYQSAVPALPFSDTTATGIIEYVGERKRKPYLMVKRPRVDDVATAHRFLSALTALVRPGGRTVPLAVDTRMFVAFGLGVSDCQKGQRRCQRNAPVIAGSMNNASFVLPTGGVPLLEAHFRNVSGVFTRDFPAKPPVPFDFTKPPARLQFTAKSTKVKTLRYNETVEVVLQNTALVARESHPMHLHGFNFFVLAQGFGNFHQAAAATKRYYLVNPQERNTVAVPPGGWAVIRFVANNPGMWLMHCHFDAHLPIGLAMAFEVQSGPTPDTALPPPPADLPRCSD